MKTSRTKGKGAPKRTRLQVLEWFVDAPFTVEVHAGRGPGAHSTLEGIRYVKLAPGILDHCDPGGFAGL
jgi:hypothetical protein